MSKENVLARDMKEGERNVETEREMVERKNWRKKEAERMTTEGVCVCEREREREGERVN